MSIDGAAAIPDAARDRDEITVLHVDDDAGLVDLSATALERENDAFTVRTATRGDDALDRLEADIDCVVSDYEMPGLDGLDLLRTIREEYPDLPFILFTGKGNEEIASEAISAGVTDYLQKGAGLDQYTVLANRIENAVTKRDAERIVERAYCAMDTAREGIALLDEAGRFKYVNQAYADITGHDRGEFVGEHWEMLYPDAHVDRVYDDILPEVPEEGRWVGETVYEREDGTRLLVDHALAYTDDGTMICLARNRSEDEAELRALREDRQRLDRFIEAVEEYAICTLDGTGCITSWNDGAERLYGYAAGEILGEHVSALYSGRDREAGLPSELLSMATDEGTVEDDCHGVRADGQQFRARVTVATVDDANPGFVHIVRDRESRADDASPQIDVDRALDALDDPFYVLDADGTVVYANERGAEMLDEWESITDESDGRGALRRALDADADERELGISSDPDRTYEFSTHPLQAGYRVGIGRDISDQKARERALSELHRTTRDLMRADEKTAIAETTTEALDEILTLTHAGVHFYDEEADALAPVAWSDRVEETIGTPPTLGRESLAWRAFQDGTVEHYDHLDTAEELHNESTPLRSELIVPLGEYGVALVASTEPAAFDENDRRLAQLLCENATVALERVSRQDVLRRREAELERENERLDEFASVVSHDLRNPINVAAGHLQLASEECDSDHLDEARHAVERMETLTEDVLSLAREGKRVDEVEPVELSVLARECWASVDTADGTLHVADDCTLMADRSRLAQVFENLFRNSVEHGSTDSRTQSGDSVEHGSTNNRTQSGDSVEHSSTDGRAEPGDENVTVRVGALDGGFYVEDDGPGIPADERDRVFEAGYSTGEDGTGFGLRIVRDIVEAHGWTVDLVRGTDGGARFEVTGVDAASSADA